MNAFRFCFLPALLLVSAAFALPAPVRAQAVVTAVNGSPITTFDVDEHVKILKLLHRPAGRAEALEDAIADRLKYDEARRWGIDASDTEVSATLAKLAAEAKLQTNALVDAATRARIDGETFKTHVRSLAAWSTYVRARNKTLGVSEEEVTAQLQKQSGGLHITDYVLRQVVFVVPAKASAADVENRIRAAQALRNRFQDCGTGLQLARGMSDVAVKETIRRASDVISPALQKVLSETPTGHLTQPARGPEGVEMIAVCDKSEAGDPTTLRERVQAQLLNDRLAAESVRMYKELRERAVVSKD